MKKILLIICTLILGTEVSLAQGSNINIQCTTLATIYHIYEINGFSFAFPDYGQVMLFQKKEVKKGKQYFKRHIYVCQYGKIKNKPAGTIMKYANTDSKRIDTLYFPNIILKLPIEINGTILNPDSCKNILFIMNGFFPKKVDRCKTSNQRHWEFNDIKRQPFGFGHW